MSSLHKTHGQVLKFSIEEPFQVMFCSVEILERKNSKLRGRGWKECRQTEEKTREVTLVRYMYF